MFLILSGRYYEIELCSIEGLRMLAESSLTESADLRMSFRLKDEKMFLELRDWFIEWDDFFILLFWFERRRCRFLLLGWRASVKGMTFFELGCLRWVVMFLELGWPDSGITFIELGCLMLAITFFELGCRRCCVPSNDRRLLELCYLWWMLVTVFKSLLSISPERSTGVFGYLYILASKSAWIRFRAIKMLCLEFFCSMVLLAMYLWF